MSWVKTSEGRRYLDGGERVQLQSPDGYDRKYEHLHFGGPTSLNGATATLRSKGWIRENEIVTVIRSCDPLVAEIPSAHLVVIRTEAEFKRIQQKEKEGTRPRRSDPLSDAIKNWDDLMHKVHSGVITY